VKQILNNMTEKYSIPYMEKTPSFRQYPRKVEYWVCSDDRTFPTEQQAKDWEKILEYQRNNPEGNANSITQQEVDIFDVLH